MLAQQGAPQQSGASAVGQQLPALPQLWPQASRAQQQQGAATGAPPSSESPSPTAGDGDDAFRTDGLSDRDPSTDPVALEAALEGVPPALNVVCNGNAGIYVVARRAIQCLCGSCCAVRCDPRCAEWLVSPTEYERHSGMPAAKKWRYSIKVAHDSEPNVSLGRWLELKGLAYKIRKNAKGGHGPDAQHQSSQQPPQLQPQLQQRMMHVPSLARAPGLAVAPGDGSEDSQQDATTGGAAGSGSCELASLEQLEPAPSDAALSALGPAARQYSLGSYGSLGRFDPADMLCKETWACADLGPSIEGGVEVPVQLLHLGPEAGPQPQPERMQRMFSDDLGERLPHGQDQPVLSHAAKGKRGMQWGHLQPQQQPQQQQQQQRASGAYGTACSNIDSGSDGPGEADGTVELTCTSMGLKPAHTPGAAKPSPARNKCSPRSRRSQPQPLPDGAAWDALDADARDSADGTGPKAAGDTGDGVGMDGNGGAAAMEWQRPAALRSVTPDADRPAGDDTCWLRSPHQRIEAPADADRDSMDVAAANEPEGSGPKGGRVGDKYQASLPTCRPVPPRNSAATQAELARAGCPGPDEATALQSLPVEQAAANMQPRDAVEDVWEEALAAQARERPPVPLALLERSQRVRRAPTWLAGESYVDPNKACSLGGGKGGGRGSDEDGVGGAVEDDNPYAGKRQSVTGSRKRTIKDDSCDSDSGAEAEAALAHIHQLYHASLPPRAIMQQHAHKRTRPGGPPGSHEPLLVQWQLGQYNCLVHLEATIVLNGRVFHGCLPAASALPQQHHEQQQQQQQQQAHLPVGQCCELCQQPAEPCDRDEEAPHALATEGLGALMPVIMPGGQVALLHRQCALWSPEVYATSRGELANLPEAVQRGRASTCSRCGSMGATLKCWQRQCTLLFHLPCARKHGCTLLPEPYTVACPGHDPSDMSDTDMSGLDDLGTSTANDALNNAAAVAGRASSCGDGTDVGAAGHAKASERTACRDGSDTYAKGSGRSSCTDTQPADVASGTDACNDGVIGGADQDRPMPADGCDGSSASAFSRGNRGLPCKVDYAKLARGIALPAARPVPVGSADAVATAALAAAAAASGSAAANIPGSHVVQPLLGQGCLSGAAAQLAMAGSTLPAQQQGMRDQGSQQPPYYHPVPGMLSRPFHVYNSSQYHAGHSALQYSHHGIAATGANGSSATQRMLNQALNRNFGAVPALAAPTTAGSAAACNAAAPEHGMVTDGIMHMRGLEEMWLGGTTGQPGRSGRCAVCVIQRKGKCGTESAPKKCLRRQMLSIAKSSKAKSVRARSGL